MGEPAGWDEWLEELALRAEGNDRQEWIDSQGVDGATWDAGWWDRHAHELAEPLPEHEDADLWELAERWPEEPPGEASRGTGSAKGELALEYGALLVRALERTEAAQARLDARRIWILAELVKADGGIDCDPMARLEAPGLAAAEVAAALRIPQRTARAKVEEALALSHPAMAPVLDSMKRGSLSRQRATIALDASVPVPASRLADFAAAAAAIAAPEDPQLVPSPGALGRRLRRLAEEYAAEPLAVRKTKALAGRRVDVTPIEDGMCYVTALLPLEDGALIDTRLGAIARSLQGTEELRTINQLRADALRDLLLGSPDVRVPDGAAAAPMTPTGGVRMQLIVTAPESTIAGTADVPGEVLGYGPIDAATARRLAATTTSWSRLVVGAEGGAPLSIGRIRYAPTAAMRRFLTARDATCRFPGCDKPAGAAEADHTIEWQHGGTTGVDNLVLLCPEHHRFKSLGHWRVRHVGACAPREGPMVAQGAAPAGALAAAPGAEPAPTGSQPRKVPPGTLEWTAPSGCTYLTYPRLEDPPPF